jgi:hypothetical protein
MQFASFPSLKNALPTPSAVDRALVAYGKYSIAGVFASNAIVFIFCFVFRPRWMDGWMDR